MATITRTTEGHSTARAALTLGALGVVFGDIGTSPLYTVQTVFNPRDPHPAEDAVLRAEPDGQEEDEDGDPRGDPGGRSA